MVGSKYCRIISELEIGSETIRSYLCPRNASALGLGRGLRPNRQLCTDRTAHDGILEPWPPLSPHLVPCLEGTKFLSASG